MTDIERDLTRLAVTADAIRRAEELLIAYDARDVDALTETLARGVSEQSTDALMGVAVFAHYAIKEAARVLDVEPALFREAIRGWILNQATGVTT